MQNEEYIVEILQDVGLISAGQIEDARAKAGAGSVVKILTEDEEPEIETDFEVKDRTPEEIKKEEEYAEE